MLLNLIQVHSLFLQVESHLSHLGVQTLTQAASVDVVQDAASMSSSLLDRCWPDRKPRGCVKHKQCRLSCQVVASKHKNDNTSMSPSHLVSATFPLFCYVVSWRVLEQSCLPQPRFSANFHSTLPVSFSFLRLWKKSSSLGKLERWHCEWVSAAYLLSITFNAAKQRQELRLHNTRERFNVL